MKSFLEFRLNPFRCSDDDLSYLNEVKVMSSEQAKQKKIKVPITGDTGLHHLKNFLSHDVLPGTPSIIERIIISGKVVFRSGIKSARLKYLKNNKQLECVLC